MAVGGALRTVALTVTANVGSFVGNLGTAAAASTAFANKHAASMTTAGAATAAFGAAAVGGLLLSAREAINWESAWAGVTKTVDGSTSQMQALEDELRSMAKTLPATHGEIAAVAEAAGQLGIKREDVAGFTKTMIDLGVSTNLTSEQAATALARFSNIMGTSASDVDRLGSSLVALGNDGASTEGEILTMANRIAGAGRSIGLSSGEVLAYANALSSLGIEAEAGGTAISTVFLKVQSAVDEGGDSLTKFARVAGVSAEDFSQKFGTDAAGAMQLFIDGLGRADAAGQNTSGIMADLGLEGIRVTDTLRRLAGNSDLLRDSVELGNSAFRENTALVEEANKRYETTASRLQVARNNLRDTAITIGDQLLPAIQQFADGVSTVADFIGGLDPAILGFATNMTGLLGAIGLLGGGLLLVVPQIAATVTAFKALSAAAPPVASALGVLGKTAGVVVALYAVGTAIAAIRNASVEAVPGIEETTSALLDMGKAGDAAAINALFADLEEGKHRFDDFAGAVQRLTEKNLGDKITDIGDGLFNVQGEAAQAEDAIAQIDGALAQLVAAGRGEEAATAVRGLVEELGGTQEAADQLMALLPGYADAVQGAERAQAEAAGSAEQMALQVAGVTQTSDEAAEAVKAFSSALDALLSQTFSVQEATDRFNEGLNSLAGTAEKNGTSLTRNTDAAIANRDAFRELAGEAKNVIDRMVENGASQEDVIATSAGLKKSLEDAATAAGFSAEQVKLYTGFLDQVPGTYTATLAVAGADDATTKIENVRVAVERLNGKTAVVNVRYTTSGNVSNVVSRTGDLPQKDGGVVSYYANGGEHHVAQIAPAGAWRVWAEPETGGEAYIPLAPAKRSRSVAIAQTVAERFGYEMVPRQAITYQAGGGVYGGSSSARGGGFSPTFNVTADAPLAHRYAQQIVGQAEKQMRDAAAVYGLNMAGVG